MNHDCEELLEKATALQFLLDEGIDIMSNLQKENQELYKAIQKHKYFIEEIKECTERTLVDEELWKKLESDGTTNP